MNSLYVFCILGFFAFVNGGIVKPTADITCPENTDDGFPAFVPSPDSCEQYYICVHGEPSLQNCPEGLWFDPSVNVCNWPDQVGNRCPGVYFV